MKSNSLLITALGLVTLAQGASATLPNTLESLLVAQTRTAQKTSASEESKLTQQIMDLFDNYDNLFPKSTGKDLMKKTMGRIDAEDSYHYLNLEDGSTKIIVVYVPKQSISPIFKFLPTGPLSLVREGLILKIDYIDASKGAAESKTLQINSQGEVYRIVQGGAAGEKLPEIDSPIIHKLLNNSLTISYQKIKKFAAEYQQNNK